MDEGLQEGREVVHRAREARAAGTAAPHLLSMLQSMDDGLQKGRVAQGVQHLAPEEQERLKVLQQQRVPPDNPERKALEDAAEQLRVVEFARKLSDKLDVQCPAGQ